VDDVRFLRGHLLVSGHRMVLLVRVLDSLRGKGAFLSGFGAAHNHLRGGRPLLWLVLAELLFVLGRHLGRLCRGKQEEEEPFNFMSTI